MKAIICTKYGSPEVLQVKEIEKPTPKDNEVLEKIFATSVTASDCIVRGFKLPTSTWIPVHLALGITEPAIFGFLLSGEIESIGDNIKQFNKGDKVFAYTFMRFGTYPEYICLPETSAIAPMPSNTSFDEVTLTPFGGTLALYYLKKANIQRGQKILAYRASGAVGTSAIQIAKHFCAEVTGVCSTTKLVLVKSLEVENVIDYTKENFTDNGKQYDLIFDAVGKNKNSHLQYKKAFVSNGKFISVDDGNPGEQAVFKDNLVILKELLRIKY